MEQEAPIAAAIDAFLQRRDGCALRLRQLVYLRSAPPCSVGIAQPAPQMLREETCHNKMFDCSGRDALLIKFRTRIFFPPPKEQKCPCLCRLSGKTSKLLVRDCSSCIVLFIERLVTLIRMILPAYEMIAQQLFYALIHRRLRQRPPQLRHTPHTVLREIAIDGVRVAIGE